MVISGTLFQPERIAHLDRVTAFSTRGDSFFPKVIAISDGIGYCNRGGIGNDTDVEIFSGRVPMDTMPRPETIPRAGE